MHNEHYLTRVKDAEDGSIQWTGFNLMKNGI